MNRHLSLLYWMLSMRLLSTLLILLAVVAVSPGRAVAQQPGVEAEVEPYPEMRRFRPLLHRELLVYRARGDGQADSVEHIDHTVRALLGAPIYRGSFLTLDALLEYQYDRHHGPLAMRVLGPDADPDDALELHRFELAVPVHLALSETWALDLGVRAIYSGDLENHDPDAWTPFGRVMATWRFEPDWAFLFGAVTARITDLGAIIPIPTVGVYYRPEDGPWGLDVFLPGRIEGRWWAFDTVPDLHLFAQTDFRGLDWHVQEEARINRLRLDGSVGARWGFWEPLEAELKVGSNLMQFTTLTPDDESIEPTEWLDGPTFTVSAGVVVRTD